jgi:hypothetical protein
MARSSYLQAHLLTACVAVAMAACGGSVGPTGPTYVSGVIETTTWRAAAGPYRVTGAITIRSGKTLTIEPGVDVLFDADVQFIIEGALGAVGTKAANIRFIKGTAEEWGGLRFSGGDSSTIVYGRVSDGHADGPNRHGGGGGVYISGLGTHLEMYGCLISGNRARSNGGGVFNWGGAATLTNCTISGNTADLGGGLQNFDGAIATLTNCTISGNTASQGGGLVNSSARASASNCTIAGNTALQGGGVVCSDYATLALTNCILWGDAPEEIQLESRGTVFPTFCDIEGGLPPGVFIRRGNIDADPLFADAPNGDYRLRSGSPCNGAGQGGVDIGASSSP